MVGRTLGHYRIVEPLGAGGMGEVFRAHDEKLDRDVALKVLPEGALSDESARERFRREANALSRLSHPHIATIFDFDTADGVDFLVMELVRGPSLADELQAKGALPEKTVVRLGAQIARGLQAAHEQGVIHRDLKPANLQLTPDGMVEILDFGLARLTAPETTDAAETAPTQTAVGRAAGTLPYMSPEQLRGRGVDLRTDLYSLGAVLYELATGRLLFSKPSAAELTEAILSEDPAPPRAVNERITPGLEAVILKALDKDPELRYQTARDLLVDLERLQLRSDSRSSGSGPVESPSPPTARVRRRWLAAAAVAAGLLAAALWFLRPSPPLRIANVRPLGIDVGAFVRPAWPTWVTDGVRLYYVAREDDRYVLKNVALAGGEPSTIPTPFGLGLELCGYLHGRSALVALARSPMQSPLETGVWLIPVPQGSPRRLGDAIANAIAISPDEERLALTIFDPGGARILFVRLDDPAAAPYAELRLPQRGVRSWHSRASWSPDGARFRFSAPGPVGHESEIWLWETSDAAEPPRTLWPGDGGVWTGDQGHFVIERARRVAGGPRSDLLVVGEKRWLPRSKADPVPLTNGPTSFTDVGPNPDGTGLLAFGEVRQGELHRFDRAKGRFERALAGESVGFVDYSPDGEWVAWVDYPQETLWRARSDGTERLQLTQQPDRAFFPTWSPDGRRVAYVGLSDGDRWSLRLASADEGLVDVVESEEGFRHWNPCWLPDGALLFSSRTTRQLGIRRFDPSAGVTTPLEGADDLLFPRCGPQGQILAFLLRDGSQVAVVRSPGDEDWQQVGPYRGYPNWTRDGQAICGLDHQENRIECYSVALGRWETLTEIERPLLGWVDDVPWMGLDAEDNPLVMFDRTTRDLYALDWEVQ